MTSAPIHGPASCNRTRPSGDVQDPGVSKTLPGVSKIPFGLILGGCWSDLEASDLEKTSKCHYAARIPPTLVRSLRMCSPRRVFVHCRADSSKASLGPMGAPRAPLGGARWVECGGPLRGGGTTPIRHIGPFLHACVCMRLDCDGKSRKPCQYKSRCPEKI